MTHLLYCIEHARREQLVVATEVSDGRSVCPEHAAGGNSRLIPIASAEEIGHCEYCPREPHRACFVVDQLALCVRHAAEAVFEDDDMGAHDMTHAAYLGLREAGIRDAY